MTTPIDPSDPCAAAKTLRSIFLSVISGQQVAEVEMAAGNGSSRRVKYTAANLSVLQAELTKYEGLCELSQGGKARRRGLRAGGGCY